MDQGDNNVNSNNTNCEWEEKLETDNKDKNTDERKKEEEETDTKSTPSMTNRLCLFVKRKFSKNRIKWYFKTHLWKDICLSLLIGISCFAYLSWPWTGRTPSPLATMDNLMEMQFTASPMQLQALAESEFIIYSILQNWTREKEEKDVSVAKLESYQHFLPTVQAYLSDYEESTGKLQGTADILNKEKPAVVLIAENPLGSFLMLHRFVVYLDKLRFPKNSQFDCDSFHKETLSIHKTLGWPTKNGTAEAIRRILRLQQVYNFTVKDMAEGRLEEIQTQFRLHFNASFEIALLAVQSEYFTLAIDWLEFIEAKLTSSSAAVDAHPKNEDLLVQVRHMFLQVLNKHDATWNEKAVNSYDTQESGQYYFDQKIAGLDRPEWIPRRTSWHYRHGDEPSRRTAIYSIVHYWRLCSGDFYQTEKEKAKLFCWLETKIHPTWTIRPVKMEFLSRSPDVVQIYNVLSDKLMDTIKGKALPELMPSRTIASPTTESTNSNTRSSIQAWLHDLDDKELLQISKTISRMTGLNLDTHSAQELLQVLSYATGGHYGIHRDALVTHERVRDFGDRVATFFCYISNVEAGGYTAFSVGGMAAKLMRGSCIYWFNVNKDMSPDANSYHGGCPVIIGQKWTASKWVRHYDQFLVRKCSLDRGESLEVAVNGV